jgi:hypothetical protein
MIFDGESLRVIQRVGSLQTSRSVQLDEVDFKVLVPQPSFALSETASYGFAACQKITLLSEELKWPV